MDKKIKVKICSGILIALVCGLLGGLAMGYQGVFSKPLSFLVKTAQGEVSIKDSLTAEQVEERIMKYIRDEILGEDGPEISLTASTTLENGVYKLNLKIDTSEFVSYVTKDGNLLFPEAIILKEESVKPDGEGEAEAEDSIPGSFLASEDEICMEDDKPIIYFFGSQGCSYCQWEHPIFEAVTNKFSNYISFHNNMDSDEDMDVFSKYSTGGIPTLVLGCKYYRVGAGTQSGEEQETKDLTALICKLTGNQPADVCEEVQDLIE